MRKLPFLDIRLVPILLFVVLILALIIQMLTPPDAPPLSVRSAEADGAMVLRLWLEENGYKAIEVLAKPISPGSIKALFVLAPLISYTEDEALRVQDWVQRGNTLIVTGDPFIVNDLLAPYEVSLEYKLPSIDKVLPSAPTLRSPAFNSIRVDAILEIVTTRSDVVPHLSSSMGPLVVSFSEGSGTVWIVAAERPFTNRGLSDQGTPQFLLNILSGISTRSAIGFDEGHHGFGELMSIPVWLFTTAPGWGILLSITLTMIFLAMQGRRFGRILALPDNRLRREPIEYIQAIANLSRRSGQRTEILVHYRNQFRRRVSDRYALDSTLSDSEWLKALVFRDPRVDETQLRDLLARLARQRITEPELVRTAVDVDEWLRRLG
jgi:hypothetical protein